MKLKKFPLNTIVLGLTISCSTIAFAEDGDTTPTPTPTPVESAQGQINFSGYINNVPCSIASESLKQDVDFGEISLSELTKAPFRSDERNFDIILKNCTTETYKSAKVKFTGSTVNDIAGFDGELLSLNAGKTQNVGIAITSLTGKTIKFGEFFSDAGSSYDLNEGQGKDTALHFTSYVKGSENSSKPASAGKFSTVANFVIQYL